MENSNQVKRETNKAMKSFFSLGLKPITSNVRLTTLVARLKRAAKMRVRSRGQPTSKRKQQQQQARARPTQCANPSVRREGAKQTVARFQKRATTKRQHPLSERERDSNREKERERDSETERAQQQKAQSF